MSNTTVRFKTPKENPERFPKFLGEVTQIRRLINPPKREWSAFNPSIAYAPNKGYAMTFRSSNYVILENGELHVTQGGKIRNQVWFTETNENFDLLNLRRINVPSEIMTTWRGLEDAKLFWREGHWYFTAVVLETHTPVARLAVCKLDEKKSEVTDIEIFHGTDAKKPEKNWMLPDLNPNPNFDFIYASNALYKDGKVIFTTSTDERISGLRGNSNLLEQPDGTYLTIMHKLWTKTTRHYVSTRMAYVDGHDKNYGHYFVRFDQTGTLVEMSKAFQFIGRGIEFVAGLTAMGSDLVVSFGRSDVSSHIGRIPQNTVEEMLETLQ
jgi:hypothetical protein